MNPYEAPESKLRSSSQSMQRPFTRRLDWKSMLIGIALFFITYYLLLFVLLLVGTSILNAQWQIILRPLMYLPVVVGGIFVAIRIRDQVLIHATLFSLAAPIVMVIHFWLLHGIRRFTFDVILTATSSAICFATIFVVQMFISKGRTLKPSQQQSN